MDLLHKCHSGDSLSNLNLSLLLHFLPHLTLSVLSCSLYIRNISCSILRFSPFLFLLLFSPFPIFGPGAFFRPDFAYIKPEYVLFVIKEKKNRGVIKCVHNFYSRSLHPFHLCFFFLSYFTLAERDTILDLFPFLFPITLTLR